MTQVGLLTSGNQQVFTHISKDRKKWLSPEPFLPHLPYWKSFVHSSKCLSKQMSPKIKKKE